MLFIQRFRLHPTILAEKRETLEELFQLVQYDVHQWEICWDLKVERMISGQQPGNTKYPCPYCDWQSTKRELHYTNHQWKPRGELVVGDKNVIAEPLAPLEKVLIPSMHVGHGAFSQFIKALKKRGCTALELLASHFAYKSTDKIEGGKFMILNFILENLSTKIKNFLNILKSNI